MTRLQFQKPNYNFSPPKVTSTTSNLTKNVGATIPTSASVCMTISRVSKSSPQRPCQNTMFTCKNTMWLHERIREQIKSACTYKTAVYSWWERWSRDSKIILYPYTYRQGHEKSFKTARQKPTKSSNQHNMWPVVRVPMATRAGACNLHFLSQKHKELRCHTHWTTWCYLASANTPLGVVQWCGFSSLVLPPSHSFHYLRTSCISLITPSSILVLFVFEATCLCT